LNQLTQSRVKEMFDYNEETGVLTWRRQNGHKKAGALAGSMEKKTGYMRVTLDRRQHTTHRVIWLYVHGKHPEHEIDHINGNRADNRICNLREATHAQNCQNRRKSCGKTSGFIGVKWNKARKVWSAAVFTNGKELYLGAFASAEAAYQAYVDAKRKLHPFSTL
jgi:hypothetical protein